MLNTLFFPFALGVVNVFVLFRSFAYKFKGKGGAVFIFKTMIIQKLKIKCP